MSIDQQDWEIVLPLRQPHPKFIETEAAFTYELQAWRDTIANRLEILWELRREQGMVVPSIGTLERRLEQLDAIEVAIRHLCEDE